MWLTNLFGVIYFSVLCAAQDTDVEAPPRPSLKLQTQSLEVYSSERVVMRCGVEGSSEWTFTWTRQRQNISTGLNSEGTVLTITNASQTDSGRYACQGHHKNKSVNTRESDSLSLQVIAPPRPSLKLQTQSLEVYPSENVVMMCVVEGSSEWTFTWTRQRQNISTGLNSEGTVLTITNTSQTDSGRYACQGHHKNKSVNTGESDSLNLQVIDLPKPSLQLQTQSLEVYLSERVEMRCGVEGSSDWIFTWTRQGQTTVQISTGLNAEGTVLNIRTASQTDSGNYFCQGHHTTRSVITGESDPLQLKVIDLPKPSLKLQTQSLEVYSSERVEMRCGVEGSSDWIFTWSRQGQTTVQISTGLNAEGTVLNIRTASQTDSGNYFCQGHHTTRSVITGESDPLQLKVIDLPKPSLKLLTPWLDVFPSERVVMSCGVEGSSHWTFTWTREGREVNPGSSAVFNSDKSVVTITATQIYSGSYVCKGHYTVRSVITGNSDSIRLHVYGNKPRPTLSKHPNLYQMYVGEYLSFSCGGVVSSGWEYIWIKNGAQLQHSIERYNISTLALSSGGMYMCKAKRGKPVFFTEDSETLTVEIIEIPVPKLELKTPWTDIFDGERTEFSCAVQGSSDWAYTWRKDGLTTPPNLSVSADGSSLTMVSAKHEYKGNYTCSGKHKSRPAVTTDSSKALSLNVYAFTPKPLITQVPSVEIMYVGEQVTFRCNMTLSSGWEYVWYHNETLSHSGNSLINNLIALDSGTYKCMAKRGTTIFSTRFSDALKLSVYKIPVPSIKPKTPWLDVFPSERLELSCEVTGSSDWSYGFTKDAQGITSSNSGEGVFSILSASESDSGEYKCRGRHKQRSTVSTPSSSGITVTVYNQRAVAVLTQMPAYEEMFTGDSLSFHCKVTVSSGWEYHWFKDNTFTSTVQTHAIKSVDETHTGSYGCWANRGEYSTDVIEKRVIIHVRPWAVMTLLTGWSDVFSTDNLILKCEVHGSQYTWNYTWFREGEELRQTQSDRHTVTPQDNPNQSDYTCQGTRNGHPSYSKVTEPFKTKNLLLKRRVLLSISGCLFFGIITVLLCCIGFRVTCKPDKNAEKPEEANLFLTMAELKARDDTPIALVAYDTEEALIPTVKADGEDNCTTEEYTESTPLPITSTEQQEVPSDSTDPENNGGLTSFKY